MLGNKGKEVFGNFSNRLNVKAALSIYIYTDIVRINLVKL